ncbi:carbonic anhydrase [Parabacteroides sp. 52]|uniref:carbonic anhydrase n=1 Tax=unclassified Parabacteroides TaxID=2649774 RepID=UPI0013D2E9A4|nr:MULTISPECIES: carbonic anhydrase [unclassified Parabacteroides]MDH6534827.1 carbonic anhydrase [Parabacteroides sp. PM5-20]NDV55547.1 carbonic anhydrase [Parabacteroides sp. 52]
MKKYCLSTRLGLILALSFCSFFSFAQDLTADPITLLKEGNKRFCSNQMKHQHQDQETLKDLTKGQHPFAVVISCSDSRVTPEIIFDQGLGDIFSIRTAGNVMADFEEGSIEYAVDHLNTQLVVVLGHTHCGAIKAFLDTKQSKEGGKENEAHAHHHPQENLGHIQSIIDKLDSEDEETEVFKCKEGDLYDKAIKANVAHGIKQLRESDPLLSKLYKDHKINIVGAIYNIESGEVEFLNL